MNSEAQVHQVAVLLPAHNEEKTIASTIKSFREVIPKATIVVIDNACTDKTGEIARSMDAVVLFEPRQGKGYAVQCGFDYFLQNEFDCCLLVDADDTYGLENLNESLEQVLDRGVDMVIGNRTSAPLAANQENSGRSAHYRRGHRIGNQAFVLLSRILLGTKIDDVLSGWRLLSRRFVASFPGGSKGFEIEAQLNSHAASINASIRNVDVSYRGRPMGSHSKLNTYRDGFRILRTTFRSFKNDRPFVAFSILAIIWLIVTLWLVYLPFKTYFEDGNVPNLPRLVTGIGTFLIASLLWVAGMILERVRQTRVTLLLQRYHSCR
jgi:glycosyltransferase involved in cell wall biosynthesis